jgi:hypothetical protein
MLYNVEIEDHRKSERFHKVWCNLLVKFWSYHEIVIDLERLFTKFDEYLTCVTLDVYFLNVGYFHVFKNVGYS